jgi:ferrous iron transport protein A
MPLSLLNIGDSRAIIKIHGKDEIRRFLEKLGFINGTLVSVISENNGNMIVKLRDTRVAISKAMAKNIFVA